MAKAKPNLQARIPPDLKRRAKRSAAADSRSLTKFVELALEEKVERDEFKRNDVAIKALEHAARVNRVRR